jgi:hypothetical protein
LVSLPPSWQITFLADSSYLLTGTFAKSEAVANFGYTEGFEVTGLFTEEGEASSVSA